MKGQKIFHPDVKMYKKKFAPEGTPEELKEWYQYRNLAFSSDYKIDESLFERSLLDEVRKGFEFLKPFFMYFKDI